MAKLLSQKDYTPEELKIFVKAMYVQVCTHKHSPVQTLCTCLHTYIMQTHVTSEYMGHIGWSTGLG